MAPPGVEVQWDVYTLHLINFGMLLFLFAHFYNKIIFEN